MSRARSGCVAGVLASASGAPHPGLFLQDLGGKALVQRVLERTRAAALVDDVIVLTSQAACDDELCAFLAGLCVPFRRGLPGDALGTVLALVAEHEPSYVVRVEGNRPFVDPDFIDLQLGALRAFDADVVRVHATSALEGTLGGQAAVSARALRLAAASADPRDKAEAGAPFLRARAGDLRAVEIEVDPSFMRPDLDLALATPGDLARARALWEAVDHEHDGLFPLGRALRWLQPARAGKESLR